MITRLKRGPALAAVFALLVGFLATPVAAAEPGFIDGSLNVELVAYDDEGGTGLAEVSWDFVDDGDLDAFKVYVSGVADQADPNHGDMAYRFEVDLGGTYDIEVTAYDAGMSYLDHVGTSFNLPDRPVTTVDDWRAVYLEGAGTITIVDYPEIDGPRSWEVTYDGDTHTSTDPIDVGYLCGEITLVGRRTWDLPGGFTAYSEPVDIPVEGVPECPDPAVIDGSITPTGLGVDVADIPSLFVDVEWDWAGNPTDPARFEVSTAFLAESVEADSDWRINIPFALGETHTVEIQAYNSVDQPIGDPFLFDPVNLPSFPADPVADDWTVTYDAAFKRVVAEYVGDGEPPADLVVLEHNGLDHIGVMPFPGCVPEGDTLQVNLWLRNELDVLGFTTDLSSQGSLTVDVPGVPECEAFAIVNAKMTGDKVEATPGDGGLAVAVDVTWEWTGDDRDLAKFVVAGGHEDVTEIIPFPMGARIHLPLGDTYEITILPVDAADNPVGDLFVFEPVEVAGLPGAAAPEDWRVVHDPATKTVVAEYVADPEGPLPVDIARIIYDGTEYDDGMPFESCVPEGDTLQVDLELVNLLDVLGVHDEIVGPRTSFEVQDAPECVDGEVINGDFYPASIEQTADGWVLATVFTWEWDGDIADVADFEISVSPLEVRWVRPHITEVVIDLPLGETVEVTIGAVDKTANLFGRSFEFGQIEVPDFTTAPVEGDWELAYDADIEAVVAIYRGGVPDPAEWGLDADGWIIDTGDARFESTVPFDGCLPEGESLSYDVVLYRDVHFGSEVLAMPSARLTVEVTGLPDCPPMGGGGPAIPTPPVDEPGDPADGGDTSPTGPGSGGPLPTPPAQAADDTPVGFLHRMYLGLFGRVADEGGLAYWMARTEAGATFDQVLAQVLQTPEAQSLLGDLDDAGFVLFLYEQILGRAPDAEGYEFWLTRLRDGSLNRTSLTNAFLGSSEMRQRVLAALGG